jgi:CO/xanthine dehydrogenase Mo-binding subunit
MATYRASGAPSSAFACESLIDELAENAASVTRLPDADVFDVPPIEVILAEVPTPAYQLSARGAGEIAILNRWGGRPHDLPWDWFT